MLIHMSARTLYVIKSSFNGSACHLQVILSMLGVRVPSSLGAIHRATEQLENYGGKSHTEWGVVSPDPLTCLACELLRGQPCAILAASLAGRSHKADKCQGPLGLEQPEQIADHPSYGTGTEDIHVRLTRVCCVVKLDRRSDLVERSSRNTADGLGIIFHDRR